jgi:glycosyltransferase involved in cell wall biosynthesis
MKPKLAVVVTHPIQYFAPVYRQIAQNDRIDISVIYLTDAGARPYYDKDFGQMLAWDVDLLGGYSHHFLRPGLTSVPKGFFQTDAPELWSLLGKQNPDAVLIYGYSRRMNWRARAWALRNRKKLLYWSDSVLIRKRSRWRSLLKRVVLPRFFRAVDVCLAVGDHNESYFLHYGVTRERLRRCPLPVDTARLRQPCGKDLPAFRVEARRALGFADDQFVVLQCGKLTDIKRPLDLMEAVAALRREGRAIIGLFVGSGALLPRMEAFALESGCPEAYRFAGFVNQRDLCRYYAAADVLAITSESEAHGQVATEAAVFGLPLVVSDQVGCVGPTDVARSLENALVYPCGDVKVLSAGLQQLMQSPEERQSMAAASRRIAEMQDISVAAQEIEAAVFAGMHKD